MSLSRIGIAAPAALALMVWVATITASNADEAAAEAAATAAETPARNRTVDPDRNPTRMGRPQNLDRPTGLKPYLLSPAPEKLSPADAQRAVDYRSNLNGEIRRLETRDLERRGRRSFDRGQRLRIERSRIDRVIRR